MTLVSVELTRKPSAMPAKAAQATARMPRDNRGVISSIAPSARTKASAAMNP